MKPTRLGERRHQFDLPEQRTRVPKRVVTNRHVDALCLHRARLVADVLIEPSIPPVGERLEHDTAARHSVAHRAIDQRAMCRREHQSLVKLWQRRSALGDGNRAARHLRVVVDALKRQRNERLRLDDAQRERHSKAESAVCIRERKKHIQQNETIYQYTRINVQDNNNNKAIYI